MQIGGVEYIIFFKENKVRNVSKDSKDFKDDKDSKDRRDEVQSTKERG